MQTNSNHGILIERRVSRLQKQAGGVTEDEYEQLPQRDPGAPIFMLNKTTGEKISLRKYRRIQDQILEKKQAKIEE